MKSKLCLLVPILAVLLSTPTGAQQELEQVAREYRLSQDAHKDYTWKRRVRFSLDGALRSVETFALRVGQDGKLERTLIETEQQGKKKKEQVKAEEVLEGIRQLLDAYTHMAPSNFGKLFDDPWVSNEPGGLIKVQARGVIHVGDVLDVWIDSSTRELHKFEITTTMQKEQVRMEAAFDRLETGLTYVSRSTIQTRHKKRQLKIETENFDFKRQGS